MAAATKLGKTYSVWAYTWDQGESNYTTTVSTKSAYQYAEYMMAIFDGLAEVIGERSARQEEQRRANVREEVRADALEERTIADAGAADADAAGQRLRSEASHLADAVSCPGTDTAAIARGETATRAAMVLSDLLSRSVETNRELAQAYDRARIAGEQCAREHDALVAKRASVSAH
ncbi:DUF2514 domain-containing protein [Pseudomonas sp. zjy_13]|uniref:DUF2514 domain-containing protein n=1 Tax=Pseudomonas sp. zjy_13 TaxID=3367263 RepID=UPI00370AF1AB